MPYLIAVLTPSPTPSEQPVFPLAAWRAFQLDEKVVLVGRNANTGRFRCTTAVRAYHPDCVSIETSSGRLYRLMTGPESEHLLDMSIATALLGEAPDCDVTREVLAALALGEEPNAHQVLAARVAKLQPL